MNLGNVIESAVWLSGTENQELRKRYEQDVCIAIDRLCKEHNMLHGPIQWFEKRPEEDRVPPVPDEIQGPNVRLLVGEATIVEYAPVTAKGSFVANLEKKDLERLRVITRRKSPMTLTDVECDELIEELGPRAALETLRYNVGVSIH